LLIRGFIAICLLKENEEITMRSKGIYPANLAFATVYQADDGPENAVNGVIRSKAELRNILSHQAPSLEDNVNFEKEQLIFVALGKRDSAGQDAQINAVIYIADRGNGLPPFTEVSYRESTSPIPVADTATVRPIFPIHVVKLRKLMGDTTFNKN
jgi:hypothetical protein